MALDFSGDMCGKCVHMDLSDKCTYGLFFSTGFKCTKGEGYQAWDGRPCSRYSPDNSENRKKQIYNALD